MARIVYGVSGEGSGHASRAREMVAHLEDAGHTVKIASYDRGYRNLIDDFDVFQITGLHIVSENNEVSKHKTLLKNLASLNAGIDSVKAARDHLFRGFLPDCVITDFEPTTAYLAQHYDLPLISLDNQHRLRYMTFPYPSQYRRQALLTKTIVRAMVPRPSVSLITTFYFGELTNQRSFLFPPILRQVVLDQQPTRGEHVLVYVTAGFETLLDVLRPLSHTEFRVYGYERNERDGALQFKPFSRDGFLADLASCKAVIATAGFTLMTEALYLGKPVLALPMQGQFEQVVNGLMLEASGYGAMCASVTTKDLTLFFNSLESYHDKLLRYPREDNSRITSKLDSLLADDLKLLAEYHAARKR
jgi:uncharacterized protein (TIGR00661 family)